MVHLEEESRLKNGSFEKHVKSMEKLQEIWGK